MAKVYDALRRAEEERRKRAGDDVSPVAPLNVDPPPAAAKSRSTRPPFWRRLFTRGKARSLEAGGAAEINKRRIAIIQPDSYVAEQFRGLRGRIEAIGTERPITTIVVSSAFPGEGKTTASVNLAAVTALSLGQRVLLIDCDLRKPKVHTALGLRPKAGLAEVLRNEVTVDDALMKVEGANFEVLPVRGRPSNPSELLGSTEMKALIEEVSRRYDRVILDSPAALGLPDAKAISNLCDGVVLVVRADFTSQQDVESMLEMLDRDRILGFLLNGTSVDQARYGYAAN
jgi:capsular exopolysaccharide synthesis family protein